MTAEPNLLSVGKSVHTSSLCPMNKDNDIAHNRNTAANRLVQHRPCSRYTPISDDEAKDSISIPGGVDSFHPCRSLLRSRKLTSRQQPKEFLSDYCVATGLNLETLLSWLELLVLEG